MKGIGRTDDALKALVSQATALVTGNGGGRFSLTRECGFARKKLPITSEWREQKHVTEVTGCILVCGGKKADTRDRTEQEACHAAVRC
jgi:hypothetical protein